MTGGGVALAHAFHGRLTPILDPPSGRVLVLDPADLGAAVASMLAAGGFLAVRMVEAPVGDVQLVTDEHEALLLARLLTAELHAFRADAALAAAVN